MVCPKMNGFTAESVGQKSTFSSIVTVMDYENHIVIFQYQVNLHIRRNGSYK